MEEGTVAYQRYVGIDIAADTFTAAWRTRAGKPTLPFTAEQTPAGLAALQRRLGASGAAPANVPVVMEATGNYWVALAVTLHEAGYRVAVVNPRQPHLSWPVSAAGVNSWHSRGKNARIRLRIDNPARTASQTPPRPQEEDARTRSP